MQQGKSIEKLHPNTGKWQKQIAVKSKMLQSNTGM